MNIYDQIRIELKKAYDNANQEQIAEKAKVSQPTIGRYLSNSKAIRSMRLETFFSLFPDVEIIFAKSAANISMKNKIAAIVEQLQPEDQKKVLDVLVAMFPEYKKVK